MPQIRNPMKLSLCITCKNRAHHLYETLPSVFMACHKAISNGWCEIVLINYNSEDYLDDYVKQHLAPRMSLGHLQYFYTEEPKHFNAAHARNIGLHLANGERFCSVDADNYLHKSFIDFVLHFPITQYVAPERQTVAKGAAGRLCAHTQVLRDLRGYDEDLLRLQDADMRARLSKAGLREVSIPHSNSIKVLEHSDSLRTEELGTERTIEQLKQQAIALMKKRRGQLARNPNGWGVAKGWLNGILHTTP